MWPLFVKQQVTVDIIMETLNFDFKVSKSFFKRQLEVQNKEWFQNWLKSLGNIFFLFLLQLSSVTNNLIFQLFNFSRRSQWRPDTHECVLLVNGILSHPSSLA